MAEQNNWQKLVVDNDYEILANEPHTIRKISNGFIPKIITDKPTGYQYSYLKQQRQYYHRILAIQFIPNPNNLPEIDHMNHIKTDNRLENLRWVSHSENMKNLPCHTEPFEYFDELPISSQRLDMYNGYEFEGYCFDQDFNVYYHNGLRYRKLRIEQIAKQYQFVRAYDINNRRITISINKLRSGNYE